jgi:hypothetical protein
MENHLWILDVLQDLHDYSVSNRLQSVTASVALALDCARNDLVGRATVTAVDMGGVGANCGSLEDASSGQGASGCLAFTLPYQIVIKRVR